MTATQTLILICSPGEIYCPACGQLLPRQHTGSGWRFDHCDRKRVRGSTSAGKIATDRCNTHLFISRGRGDPHVIVAALSGEAAKAQLLEILEASAAA